MEMIINSEMVFNVIILVIIGVISFFLVRYFRKNDESQAEQKADTKAVLAQLATNSKEFLKANEHLLVLINQNKLEIKLIEQSQKTHVEYTETRFEAGMNKIAANAKSIVDLAKKSA